MATVNKREPTGEEKSKLLDAAKTGDVNTIRVLARSGVDVTGGIISSLNHTALHIAAGNGQYSVVAYLLSHGARVNDVDDTNCTALHIAAQFGHCNVVAYLLSHGARVHDINHDGWTPLHYAAFSGHAEIADQLVKNGASISMKDKLNKTPLQLAEQFDKLDVVLYLKQQTQFGHKTQQKIDEPSKRAEKKRDAGVSVDTQLVKGAVVISQIKDKQSTPTMQDLNRYVIKKYAANWEDIGLELGLPLNTLEIFSKNNQKECVSCFRSTLNEWLNLNPNATWSMLEVAITNVRRISNGLDPVTDVYGTS